MAWGFKVKCDECGHEWEAMSASCNIGKWSWMEEDNRLELFCPKCILVARCPRRMDRNCWRKWQDELKNEKRVLAFTRAISKRIEAQLASAKPYEPVSIDLGYVECPLCAGEMDKLIYGEKWRIICPLCQKRSTLVTESHSHIQLVPILDEFG